MSNLQEIREHLKELENSFEIGSFSKEYIKEYAKCFFMGLSMFLEQQKEEQDKENKEKDCHKEQLLNQDDKEYKEELIKSIQTNIAKNQEIEKISFETWANKIQERVLPELERIVTHKLKDNVMPQLNSQLESFKKDELDLSSVFEIQRKNTQMAYRLAIGGLIGVISLSVALAFLMPLKQIEPYFIDFSNSDKHFAVVQKADTKVDYGEAFLRSLVGSYIMSRETINHIDDKIRLNETIREQSSDEVWKTLEQLVSGKGSIYSNSNMDREIKLEHKLEQKVAPQNTLKEQEVTPLKSAELLQSQVKREFKEKKKAQKHFKAMQTKNGFFLGSEIAITGTKLTQSLSLISNATDDLITYSHTSSNANFNMGVLMGYQHYFGATKKHGIKFSMHLYGGTPSSITTNIDIYKSKVSSNYTPLNFGLDIKYLFDFLNVIKKNRHTLGLSVGFGWHMQYYFAKIDPIKTMIGAFITNKPKDIFNHGFYPTIGLHYYLNHHQFEVNYRFGGAINYQSLTPSKIVAQNGNFKGEVLFSNFITKATNSSYIAFNYAYLF